MKILPAAAVAAVVLGLASRALHAQVAPGRFDVGIHVAGATSSQFDQSDVGVGGRFAWRPLEMLGVESEVTLYPRDFPETFPFSRGRIEGLFGVTLGKRIASVMPFARFRSGFLRIGEAPQPFPCIRIFPPPLACELSSGRTLPALDIGGGIQLLAARGMFLRVDAGDRLLRYPGPVLDADNIRRDGSFVSHDFRVAAGAGVRF